MTILLLRHWAAPLLVASALLTPFAASALPARAADQPVVRSVGCSPDSLRASLKALVVAPLPESDDESDADESASDEQQPAIKGSIELRGVNEDDSKAIAAALAARTLTIITPADATAAAKAALVDADQRSFKKPGLELENSQAVWSIETTLKGGGTNPNLEVKVDAGNGNILSIECD